MVIYKVVTYRRWPLMRSGHYERVDCNSVLLLLTPRVKPWVIQSFLTFDSMDRI